jgi:hypothetical protein
MNWPAKSICFNSCSSLWLHNSPNVCERRAMVPSSCLILSSSVSASVFFFLVVGLGFELRASESLDTHQKCKKFASISGLGSTGLIGSLIFIAIKR